MPSIYHYRSDATWTSNRRGIVEAEEIPRTINFSAPVEFNGEPGLWTPEHLLVSAAATCFLATFRSIAEISYFEMVALQVSAEGILEKTDGGLRFTQMILRPALAVANEDDQERGLRLLEKAERSCLVVRSLNCQIVLEPTVTVEILAHAM